MPYCHPFRSIRFLFLTILAALLLGLPGRAERRVTQPRAITSLIDRIGGEGAARRFVTIVDPALADSGRDVFVISARKEKPCITGSSVLATATGLNWYLNHYAHVNLSWNRLTTDLTRRPLPLPEREERRVCEADYRYYLNYCTFSYSMSVWTWERWQQEIDWMALHGINMPLQIVGLDVVWHRLLTRDLGYSEAEAGRFIAGPCFQAWWGMNNLEGWGGPNPAWWYDRQARLARLITSRQRELGMQPVLPGYSGMVPSDIGAHGVKATSQGRWCGFMRPYILDPNTADFARIAALYYKRLTEVMGPSRYYSMDPFHEGGHTEGIDVPAAYGSIEASLKRANPSAKWVIQSWQWSKAQRNVLRKVRHGDLIVLDLFSDGQSYFDRYEGHDAIYCMLPNYGGRTGFFGRLTRVMTDYYAQRAAHPNIRGIGATPEAIGQTPVLYDALFELPWCSTPPSPAAWLADYTTSRYGAPSHEAQEAWEIMRHTALACPNPLQGPHEAACCARPSLDVDRVSTWGGTELFYDPSEVVKAARLLSRVTGVPDTANLRYDLADFTRQALTDHSLVLLQALSKAYRSGDRRGYEAQRDSFLTLLSDIDRLLQTDRNFLLGHWTQMARHIADEATGTTEADRRWLELDNARTLITTWGPREASEEGGLHDYSYREWAGLMRDFYLPRWRRFFAWLDAGSPAPAPDWFAEEWAWAHNASLSYPDQPSGNTTALARQLLEKYFGPDTTTPSK